MTPKRSSGAAQACLKFAAAVVLLACCCTPRLHAAKPAPREADPIPRLRVLFVGNSYTFVNDVPDLVARVAAARGIELVTGLLAEPDY